MSAYLERTAALIGRAALEHLQDSTVVVAGLGGVGGHCAETLARTGVGRLILVDFDTVQPSNLNRQVFATKSALGLPKTEAARRRLEDVSDCTVETLSLRIDETTVCQLPCDADFIVDAVDQLTGKLALVRFALEYGMPIVSCMGAANRTDATAFCVKDVFQTERCPLARRMRQELRKRKVTALPVVCSDEEPQRPAPGALGSLAPATGAAGLVAAGYVICELIKEAQHGDKCPTTL